jgi:hypothetical protein
MSEMSLYPKREAEVTKTVIDEEATDKGMPL